MTEIIPVILLLLVIASGFYSLLALYCTIDFFRPQKKELGETPSTPISILKPLSGSDPELFENIKSFCVQDYPEYEVLLGVTDPNEPALAEVGQGVRIVVSEKDLGANKKVSNLSGLAGAARYPLIAISDSDMRVDASYLEHIAREYFSDENTGLVTSLYKISDPLSVGAAFESLTMALDLIPSVLVARRLEGVTFGLGASMLFTRDALDAIGGFEGIADYLADDYQLGNRLWRKGYKIVLSRYLLEDKAGIMSFAQHVKHQIRWARTYRACRPKGFLGYGITYIFPISCLLFIGQLPAVISLTALGAAVCIRLCLALVIWKKVIRDKNWLRWLVLLPVKDICGFVIWIWSLLGQTVVWRGSRYLILKDGKIRKMA